MLTYQIRGGLGTQLLNLMAAYADAFDQDISSWCVSQIGSQPPSFSVFSGITLDLNLPNWGSVCD